MPEQSQDCLRLGHILDLTVISLASVLQPGGGFVYVRCPVQFLAWTKTVLSEVVPAKLTVSA